MAPAMYISVTDTETKSYMLVPGEKSHYSTSEDSDLF